jgi:hypothetical protein
MPIMLILATLIKEGPDAYAAVMKIRALMSETDRNAFDKILADGDAEVTAAAERLANS